MNLLSSRFAYFPIFAVIVFVMSLCSVTPAIALPIEDKPFILLDANDNEIGRFQDEAALRAFVGETYICANLADTTLGCRVAGGCNSGVKTKLTVRGGSIFGFCTNSNTTSTVDNFTLNHIHDASDYAPGSGSSGCVSCGAGSASAGLPSLTLHRYFRSRNMTQDRRWGQERF